jgi:molybdopterin-guanine dinucleotide biosynthesis protein A
MGNKSLSWVILAGGRASRMGGNDKGLILLNNEPLIKTVYDRLTNQVDDIKINANRNHGIYSQFAPVFNDEISGFQGPLAGIHASLLQSSTSWVGFTPCDAPNIPDDLVKRLSATLEHGKEVYVANDGTHAQPVFSIWHKNALPKLSAFLQAGDRKIKMLLEKCDTVYVDFSDNPDTFINLNTPEQLAQFGHNNKLGNYNDNA